VSPAHRGGAALWPENSLLAFRSALALGVDALELDLHLTADGEVVVLHDPTLERTSTGRGAVRDARLADLASVRLKTREGAATVERVRRCAGARPRRRKARASSCPRSRSTRTGSDTTGSRKRCWR
jgi:glycerophosphoryl diester phosphodiesterase